MDTRRRNRIIGITIMFCGLIIDFVFLFDNSFNIIISILTAILIITGLIILMLNRYKPDVSNNLNQEKINNEIIKQGGTIILDNSNIGRFSKKIAIRVIGVSLVFLITTQIIFYLMSLFLEMTLNEALIIDLIITTPIFAFLPFGVRYGMMFPTKLIITENQLEIITKKQKSIFFNLTDIISIECLPKKIQDNDTHGKIWYLDIKDFFVGSRTIYLSEENALGIAQFLNDNGYSFKFKENTE